MLKRIKLTRRNVLLGGLAAGAAGAFGFKPKDSGANHSPYFKDLSDALRQVKLAKPTLVIDYDKLIENVRVLQQHVGQRFEYRIVAKSLPSIPLLKTVMHESQTEKLMLFHQPFLNQVAEEIPQADILMGKPMPVFAAEAFYKQHTQQPSVFNPEKQLQWLIDSPQRLQQYQALAENLQVPMNINIELDVGLHRGGVTSDTDFVDMLNTIRDSSWLTLSGLMGYEPHIGKVPGGVVSNRDKAMAVYRHYLSIAESTVKISPDDLCLNCGGSPTYQYYDEGDFPFNELSAGSCLVKPKDFDSDSLADHVAASFIATPVLKVLNQTEIPGVDSLGEIMSAWDPNRQKTFFTYGGYWKAEPESPQGLKLNPIFGRSTNQEMYNGSNAISLNQDDWIFMRPTQSESVFLQFGDIAVYRDGKIQEMWPVFS